MEKAVFLNAARLDFDGQLDFTPVSRQTQFTRYEDSDPVRILERVRDHHTVITKELPVGGELIRNFPPTVKMICEAGTGYNNIDIAAAREKGIAVCNIPSYSTDAVAQLVITFILNLSASLPQQQAMLHRGDFSNFTRSLQVPHRELGGKFLGIIGGGAIGQQVAAIARVLGMKVLLYSRTVKNWGDSGIQSVSLEELLRTSDYVSLHCPLTDETRHLMDRQRLRLMKPSACLINTARGAIVNETDLIAALREGSIAGAALDVQDPEPPDAANPLFAMEQVILTPHIGWRRLETRQRLVNLLGENIAAFLRGQPIHVVNR
ncbi:MAG TPA: NAD(P)-dependent oxidoreductase [Patescibacteria group bacterium]|nr:NAD(P)-dependent oxidoreductase [Patescibacteria group bacterium]